MGFLLAWQCAPLVIQYIIPPNKWGAVQSGLGHMQVLCGQREALCPQYFVYEEHIHRAWAAERIPSPAWRGVPPLSCCGRSATEICRTSMENRYRSSAVGMWPWMRHSAQLTISSPGRTRTRTRSRLPGERSIGKRRSFPFRVPGRSGWRWPPAWGTPGS